MAAERSTDAILEGLYAQAKSLWGEADADRQRQALRQTAEEIALVTHWEVPADLEPRFF
jgi:hypothetical protein